MNSQKGISPLIASVLLIAISIGASLMISGWLSTTTTAETTVIRNSTSNQLQCQFADIYINNATYNCAFDCITGNPHTTALTIVNSGKKSVSLDRFFLRNTTGDVTELKLNETKLLRTNDRLTVTNVTYDSCDGLNRTIELITVSSIDCPVTAYDSLDGTGVTYVNC